jgi:hypothetical protein
MDNTIRTANINETWLLNIYENIKKIENYERLAREGCTSVMEYVQMPIRDREINAGLIQYKNLKILLTEFILLLADLTPTIRKDKIKEFHDALDSLENIIQNENYLLVKRYDENNKIISINTTNNFNYILKSLHKLKIELFDQIKHILYIQPLEHE